jgi:hypothetical protein
LSRKFVKLPPWARTIRLPGMRDQSEQALRHCVAQLTMLSQHRRVSNCPAELRLDVVPLPVDGSEKDYEWYGWQQGFHTRRLLCFRCLELGHVHQDCTSTTDRFDRCYRCEEPEYRARDCPARAPHCRIYADLVLTASNHMRSPAYESPASKRPMRDGGSAMRKKRPHRPSSWKLVASAG